MYALAIHAGAGALPRAHLTPTREQDYRRALSTALETGQRVLAQGGPALDAVEASVCALEDEPLFNAGRGAVLTIEGNAELDAAIMDGRALRAGAVALVRRVKNPVQLARRVLELSPHVLLAGEAADRYAAELGMPLVENDYFITPQRREQFEQLTAQRQTPDEDMLGTVGAVARDAAGELAAATSTGGMAGKRAGRIGDSPVIGAGTYADSQTCAVSTTGHGEWFMRTVQAYDIAARLRYGSASLAAAVDQAITQRLAGLGAAGGLIAVDRAGQIVMGFNTPAMFRASIRDGEAPAVLIY